MMHTFVGTFLGLLFYVVLPIWLVIEIIRWIRRH